jgi:hypothetical protein
MTSITVAGQTQQVVVQEVTASVVEVITPGPQGPSGDGGSSQIGVPTFIQSTQPTTGELGGQDQYLWWDTSGGNLTLWIEDGEP